MNWPGGKRSGPRGYPGRGSDWSSARIQIIPGWRIDETRTVDSIIFSLCANPAGPRRPAAAGRRSALRNGVLLQGAMGASAGIPTTLPEEPLPVASEERGEWPHAVGIPADAP